MIFDTDKEKDVKKVGDIKNNNVSIDTANIDFIVTILSTNLYSKPIESFIRETVSNAWDSHVEAGVDDPVILELLEDTEGVKYCRIQDFGVGLSPERFNSIYRNIGSSTKRSDNTQIGGFGIGRFSALAYSDVVHITSTYEGTRYLYLMYKDGNSISIDLLDSHPTTERNGLEVKLEIKDGDLRYFTRAIKSQLVYFENLYIINSCPKVNSIYLPEEAKIEDEYNNFAIKKYDNFWVNTLDQSAEVSLVLGKVRYPLRIDSLSKVYSDRVSRYPISLVFEIGELDVTPNREEILYSAKNTALIEAKLDAAIEEIKVIVKEKENEDFTNFSKFIEALKEKSTITLLEANDRKVLLPVSEANRKITLDGVLFDNKNFLAMYDAIMSHRGIMIQYEFRNNQIKYVSRSTSINSLKDNFSTSFIGDLSNVKNISKRYIRETFEDNSTFIKRDKPIKGYIKSYIKNLKNILDSSYYMDKRFTHFDKQAFKVIVKYILGNLSKMKSFSDASVPTKWIEDTKAADKAKRKTVRKQGFDWKQNINLYRLRYTETGYGITTDSRAMKLEGLSKSHKNLTIYSVREDPKLRTLYKYLKERHNTGTNMKPVMVEVAPTKVKLLKNIENFVNIKDVIDVKYKLIRNIGTAEYLKRKLPHLKELSLISNLGDISERLATAVTELANFVKIYESNSRYPDENEENLIKEIFNLCTDKDYFNEEIRGLYLKYEEELKNAEILISFVDQSTYGYGKKIPDVRINGVVDYLLARKLIRPSIKAVLKLKKETIFNIKEEEDENNEN